MRHIGIGSLAAALLLGATVAGCGSGRAVRVESPEAVIEKVDKGDEVIITSKNGKRYRFVVTKITNKALYGEHYRVSYDEMEFIEVEGEDGVFKKLGERLF